MREARQPFPIWLRRVSTLESGAAPQIADKIGRYFAFAMARISASVSGRTIASLWLTGEKPIFW